VRRAKRDSRCLRGPPLDLGALRVEPCFLSSLLPHWAIRTPICPVVGQLARGAPLRTNVLPVGPKML